MKKFTRADIVNKVDRVLEQTRAPLQTCSDFGNPLPDTQPSIAFKEFMRWAVEFRERLIGELTR